MTVGDAPDLIVSFPAAGAGGTTMEQMEKLAARRGAAYLALPNPAAPDDTAVEAWRDGASAEIRLALDRTAAGRVLLVGHCMGGLSAIHLLDGLGDRLARPVRVLVVNTPCPDASGRIPTMSGLPDAGIAELLAHDGFPADLLEDEDMLAEIAAGLRADARVADRLAERVAAAPALPALHVLSTRGDTFVPPRWCADWMDRVSGEFRLTVTAGGHAIDESSAAVLNRVLEAATAATGTSLP